MMVLDLPMEYPHTICTRLISPHPLKRSGGGIPLVYLSTSNAHGLTLSNISFQRYLPMMSVKLTYRMMYCNQDNPNIHIKLYNHDVYPHQAVLKEDSL